MTSAKTLNDCITAFLASVGRHAPGTVIRDMPVADAPYTIGT